MSDSVFERWQERVRENEAHKMRQLAKQNGDDMIAFVEKIVERVVPENARVVDPDAPHGRCADCGTPFKVKENGRLDDHVCPTVTLPSERELAEQQRLAQTLERPVRHRRGSFGYDDDDD